MAVVAERHNQRRYSPKSAERRYWISGVTDESSAWTAVAGAIGGTIPSNVTTAVGTFPIDASNIQLDETDSTNRYEATVQWKNPDYSGASQPAGSFKVSFDISGQNVRVMQMRDWAATGATYFDPAYKPRPTNGAINVNKDGVVEGVDMLVPFTTVTIDATVDVADVDDAYVYALTKLVGSVNDDTFHDFAAGELLFTRVSGRQRDKDNYDLSFGFAYSENQDGSSTPGIIIGNIDGGTKLPKNGWDYLWVYYEQEHDATNHVIKSVPTNAYIGRIYPYKSWTGLGV